MKLSIGLAGAVLLSRLMEGMLVSIAACLLPARRATLVDPLTALRAE